MNPAILAVVDSRAELAASRTTLSGRVAVVMTMGALHEGHAALLRAARAATDAVIVTAFVNPLQFGADEDLERYPRTRDADLSLCAHEGVDLVFAPAVNVVYPRAPLVTVHAGSLGQMYEGASRPGHFDGVLTVVAKLLHLTAPDVAVFGEKDFQQLVLVRRMVADLDVGVEVLSVPTVREPDGLALSSRNRYLAPDERERAPALYQALRVGAAAARAGLQAVLPAAQRVLEGVPGLDLDYLALLDEQTLGEPGPGSARLLVAARFGPTRLIDNVPVILPSP